MVFHISYSITSTVATKTLVSREYNCRYMIVNSAKYYMTFQFTKGSVKMHMGGGGREKHITEIKWQAYDRN